MYWHTDDTNSLKKKKICSVLGAADAEIKVPSDEEYTTVIVSPVESVLFSSNMLGSWFLTFFFNSVEFNSKTFYSPHMGQRHSLVNYFCL